jgi:ribosomal-protein-alanine N-acetyltransferase
MHLPPYSSFPVLTTAGMLLRQVEATDLANILDISFYDARPATSIAEAGTMLRQINEDYARGESVHWGIADPQTNRIMGTVGYYRGFSAGTGELGCVLKPAFRGRGLMQSAMRLAIQFGLRTMGLQNIIARTSAQNTPAIRLLERLQFRRVATESDSEIHYSLP